MVGRRLADGRRCEMGMMSRRKGAAGEREAAAVLSAVLGTRCHRGRQYRGGPESPDIAGGVEGLHVEVKRVERLRLYEALRQASGDAGGTQVPVVMHRANHKPWVVIVEAELLVRLLDAVDAARAKLEPGDSGPGSARGVTTGGAA